VAADYIFFSGCSSKYYRDPRVAQYLAMWRTSISLMTSLLSIVLYAQKPRMKSKHSA